MDMSLSELWELVMDKEALACCSAVKDKAQDSGDASQPCDAFSIPAVPSLFITRDWFWERQFFHRWCWGDGFGMIAFIIIIILQLLCTLFLLLHQLCLR